MSAHRLHPYYAALVAKAAWCHEKGRTSEGVEADDIARARLYSYAFRLHTIGAFHATGVAVAARPPANALSAAHRARALETLQDLADQGMDPVPDDFRALLSTFYRYHRGVERVERALRADSEASGDGALADIAENFGRSMAEITGCNGIHLTRDTHSPRQASFVVPALGITIVPLVYGEHHSWNLAYLGGARSDVPYHRHHNGVEIHLGYSPIAGYVVLGDSAAKVTEGYAMPIPPNTRHGYTNDSEMSHHIPFIFGSLKHGGWGVFLDVESQLADLADLTVVQRDRASFNQMIHLEREIAAAARTGTARRWTLIPATVTDRDNSGGLELSITRVTPRPFRLAADTFLAASIVRGSGTLAIAGVERDVETHDHFCVPAGLAPTLIQRGNDPFVVLDAAIRARSRR
ncbi:MAG: hypothetical protein ABIP55_02160 [Tepidisphaeraceae bacterium]